MKMSVTLLTSMCKRINLYQYFVWICILERNGRFLVDLGLFYCEIVNRHVIRDCTVCFIFWWTRYSKHNLIKRKLETVEYFKLSLLLYEPVTLTSEYLTQRHDITSRHMTPLPNQVQPRTWCHSCVRKLFLPRYHLNRINT